MSLPDKRKEALIAQGYSGADNNMMIAWAQGNGATSGQYNLAVLQVLRANGALSIDFNTAWKEFLEAQGYTGSFNDMEWDFWNDGGTLFAFSADLTSSLIPATGTFDSFTRGDADATVKDFEGLVKDVTADESRFVGARRAENLLGTSSFLSTGVASGTFVWEYVVGRFNTSLVANPDNGEDTALRIEVTSTLGGTLTNKDPSPFVLGSVYTNSLYIRIVNLVAGDTVKVTTGLGFSDADIMTVPEDGEWYRVATDPLLCISAGDPFSVIITGAGATGTIIELWSPQVENVIGQANQNPSEYVSVGIGTEDELINEPSFSADPSITNYWSGLYLWNSTDQRYSASVTGQVIMVCAESTEVGKLYAVTYTRGGTSVVSVSPLSGGVSLTSRVSAGTYTEVIRSTSIADLFEISFITTGLDFWIDDVSVKEIDHGSNADGVKYFETTNSNTVVSNIVSTVANAGTNVTSDPDFTATSGGGDPWLAVSNSALHASDYFYNTNTSTGIVEDVLPDTDIVAGQTYGADVTIDQITSGQVQFVVGGTVSAPITTVGTHRIYITATTNADPQFAFVGMSGADHIRVSSCSFFIAGDAIPDDVLKGVLIEGASTNYFLNSGAPVTQAAMVTGGVIPHTLSITGDYVVNPDGLGNKDSSATFTWTPGGTANIVIVSGTIGTVQIEPLAYPTSYIPTTTASLTRDVELLEYIPPVELTVADTNDFVTICEFYITYVPSSQSYICSIQDSGGSNGIRLFMNNTGLIRFRKRRIAVNYDADSNVSVIAGSTYKLCARISSTNGVSLFISKDGGAGVLQTLENPDTVGMNMTTIGNVTFKAGMSLSDVNQLGLPMKDLKIIKGDFTDAECIGFLI